MRTAVVLEYGWEGLGTFQNEEEALLLHWLHAGVHPHAVQTPNDGTKEAFVNWRTEHYQNLSHCEEKAHMDELKHLYMRSTCCHVCH